jgi:hypothetical protein
VEIFSALLVFFLYKTYWYVNPLSKWQQENTSKIFQELFIIKKKDEIHSYLSYFQYFGQITDLSIVNIFTSHTKWISYWITQCKFNHQYKILLIQLWPIQILLTLLLTFNSIYSRYYQTLTILNKVVTLTHRGHTS